MAGRGVSLEVAKGNMAFPLSLKGTRLPEGGTWFSLPVASSRTQLSFLSTEKPTGASQVT